MLEVDLDKRYMIYIKTLIDIFVFLSSVDNDHFLFFLIVTYIATANVFVAGKQIHDANSNNDILIGQPKSTHQTRHHYYAKV